MGNKTLAFRCVCNVILLNSLFIKPIEDPPFDGKMIILCKCDEPSSHFEREDFFKRTSSFLEKSLKGLTIHTFGLGRITNEQTDFTFFIFLAHRLLLLRQLIRGDRATDAV